MSTPGCVEFNQNKFIGSDDRFEVLLCEDQDPLLFLDLLLGEGAGDEAYGHNAQQPLHDETENKLLLFIKCVIET